MVPPSFSIILIPSPVLPGWLVVTYPSKSDLTPEIMSRLAPKPPVVTTTADAVIVFSLVWSKMTLTPLTLPSFSVISLTLALTKRGMPCSCTFFTKPLTRYCPTAEPSSGRCVRFSFIPPVIVILFNLIPIESSQSIALAEWSTKKRSISISFVSWPPFKVSS
ncbi:hypothetical protein D3C78_1078120 [compost metagenome]